MLILHRLVVGALDTNCYIVASSQKRKAVVIDPGGETKEILNILKEENLDLKYIINTHGHADHIGADYELNKITSAPICIHSEDKRLLQNPGKNVLFCPTKPIPVSAEVQLKDGMGLKVPGLKVEILYTPGHTPGSISILMGNSIFTGDLLFKGSVGRTDLPGGSYETLLKSLKKILNLPNSTKIYPGHGEETTLAEEKRYNPFLQQAASDIKF